MKVTKYNLKISDGLPKLVKEKSQEYSGDNISSSKDVVELMSSVYHLDKMAEEYIYAIGVDTKRKVLGVFEIIHGTVNRAVVSPREIYIRMLLCGACEMFIVHNHPSGDPTASQEDIKLTERIRLSSQLLNIPLLDHVIIGDPGYYSIMEKGDLIDEHLAKWK